MDDIARAFLLTRPKVGVVLDATLLMGRYGITLHNPLDGTLAIDDVVVGCLGNFLDGDTPVVNDGTTLTRLWETHLLYNIGSIFVHRASFSFLHLDTCLVGVVFVAEV